MRLKGKRIAVLVAAGVEDLEFLRAIYATAGRRRRSCRGGDKP